MRRCSIRGSPSVTFPTTQMDTWTRRWSPGRRMREPCFLGCSWVGAGSAGPGRHSEPRLPLYQGWSPNGELNSGPAHYKCHPSRPRTAIQMRTTWPATSKRLTGCAGSTSSEGVSRLDSRLSGAARPVPHSCGELPHVLDASLLSCRQRPTSWAIRRHFKAKVLIHSTTGTNGQALSLSGPIG